MTLHQDQSCHHSLLLGMQALSTFLTHKNQRNVMICLMSHSREQESNPVVWPLDIQSPSQSASSYFSLLSSPPPLQSNNLSLLTGVLQLILLSSAVAFPLIYLEFPFWTKLQLLLYLLMLILKFSPSGLSWASTDVPVCDQFSILPYPYPWTFQPLRPGASGFLAPSDYNIAISLKI